MKWACLSLGLSVLLLGCSQDSEPIVGLDTGSRARILNAADADETNCSNGTDEAGGDALIDCLDEDCAADPFCLGGTENTLALCTDQTDNDSDVARDCEDPDCAPFCADDDMDTFCPAGKDVNGDGACNYTEQHSISNDEDCDDHSPFVRPDLLENSSALCTDGIDNNCPQDGADGDDPLCASVLTGDETTRAACSDGIDNSTPGALDGLIDCEDPDCAAMCTDGDGDQWCPVGFDTDNSGDCDNTEVDADPNLQDCNDASGAMFPTNLEDTPAKCIDTLDNDCAGNGIDSFDPNCSLIPNNDETTVALCTNGIDDSGADGLVDCEDPDCATVCDDSDGDGFCPVGEDLNSSGDCDNTEATSGRADDDCNDSALGINPDEAEDTRLLCLDNVDNDCSEVLTPGTTDETDPNCALWADLDDDGYCAAPSGGCIDAADQSGDCDDQEPLETPGNTVESAAQCDDGFDNDCDLTVDASDSDCGGTIDLDHDGWCPNGRDLNGNGVCVGGAETGQAGDCNELDASINPGATELPADDVDQDCDGIELCYPDVDNDGFGAAAGTTNITIGTVGVDCTAAPNASDDRLDCNDSVFAIKPTGVEVVGDGIDQNCDDVDRCYTDVDNDNVGTAVQLNGLTLSCTADAGRAPIQGDCNDMQSLSYPGNPEVCDDIDNDCNNQVDEASAPGITYVDYYEDGDSDTWGAALVVQSTCDGAPLGFVARSGDCDDTVGAVNPDANEVCDGIDNNCMAGIDEAAAPGVTYVDYWRDGDNDTYGNPSMLQSTCNGAPAGYVNRAGDCVDTQASINPGANEICDGIDNNCEHGIDEASAPGVTYVDYWRDADSDTYGNPAIMVNVCSGQPAGYVTRELDCDDTRAAVNPSAAEICDIRDNNCDGQNNEASAPTITYTNYYRDQDVDTYGDPGNVLSSCMASEPGRVTNNTDCNDSDASVYLGAFELCDGQDNDCNGLDDAGAPGVGGVEHDNDGDGLSECQNDCDDQDPLRSPALQEITANNKDNDCNGTETCYVDNDRDGFGTATLTGQSADWACPTLNRFSSVTGDCVDSNAAIFPTAVEGTADAVDQNCDGLESCYQDLDNDTFGTTTTVLNAALSCQAAQVANRIGDCDDTNGAINPDAIEIFLNTVDEDCDGETQIVCYADGDGDGVGAGPSIPTAGTCPAAQGLSYAGTDCNDSVASIYPGFVRSFPDGSMVSGTPAPEIVGDGIDQDCNGQGGPTADEDNDGLSYTREVTAGTLDTNPDMDGDTLLDGVEVDNGSNPLNPDTDGDGVRDDLEYTAGSSPSPLDTDNDGLFNYEDTDDDGDNVPTANELNRDTDGDALVEYLDPDDDNDGILTRLEVYGAIALPLQQDSDADGVPNFRDADDDNDGIPTATETALGNGPSVDTDGDGLAGHIDFDSDDDTIDDGREWGESPGQLLNTDGTFPPDIHDVDDDGDTLPTALEGDDDLDGDTIPNYLDLEADGDLVPDLVEAMTGCMDPFSTDTDQDGVDDHREYADGTPDFDLPPRNTDENSLYIDFDPDPCDEDDDGDTLATAYELQFGGVDADQDANGVVDYLDFDNDGDGMPGWVEDRNADQDGSNDDTDGDLIVDARDTDDDGEGIPSEVEIGYGADPWNTDSDGDGVRDDVEWGCPGGVCIAPWAFDAPRNTDTEANGGAGAFACHRGPTPLVPTSWTITMGNTDETIDALDIDDDNDGLSTGDAYEGGTETDTDEDGIPDFRDLDADGDDRIDACEGADDFDLDLVPNWIDPDDTDGETGDPDNDKLTSGIEIAMGSSPASIDSDGDGISDCIEAGLSEAFCLGNDPPISAVPATLLDTDGDQTPDLLDEDDDQDGLTTRTEIFLGIEVRTFEPRLLLTDARDCPFQGTPRLRRRAIDPQNPVVFEYVFTCTDELGNRIVIDVDPDGNDLDQNSVPNRLDSDDDGDGRLTVVEGDVNGNGDYFDDDGDGDGLPNFVDAQEFDGPLADADRDGLTNGEERAICAGLTALLDGLGLDCEDLVQDDDIDADGLPDGVEGGLDSQDSDGDGIPDFLDGDDDGDCVPTAVEGAFDLDGDGVPNHLENQSDGAEQLIVDDAGNPVELDDTLEWFGMTLSELGVCPEAPLCGSRSECATLFIEAHPGLDSDCDGLFDIHDNLTNVVRGSECYEPAPIVEPPAEACGCRSSSGAPTWMLVLALGVALSRGRGSSRRDRALR